MEVLKRIIKPTIVVPKRMIKAPTLVKSVATPPQASLPNIPARERVRMDTKNKSMPTITLGWLRGILNLEIKSPKLKKMKGKKTVVQEK